MLHVLIRNDWLDHEFIDAHTVDFDEAAAAVADMTPAWAAGITGVPAARIEEAAELWGTSATGMMLHARGIEQQTKGVDNVLAAINLGLATGKFGKPGCGVSTITGQGNGQGGREHGHKCDQLPGNRDITNPEHRAAVAKVWKLRRERDPRQGHPRAGDHRGDPRRHDQGAAVDLLQPGRVGARQRTSPARRSTSSSSTPSSTSSCPSPPSTPTSCCPARCTRRTRAPRPAARAASSRSTPPSRHPARPGCDWEILLDIAERLGKGEYFPYTNTDEIFDELCRASGGGTADYTGATWQRVEDEMGLFWPIPEAGHPGTPRLHEGGQFSHPRRQGPLPRRARTSRRPRSSTTSTRCGSPPGASSASTCRAPRPAASPASSSSTPSRCARSTPSSPSTLGIADGDQITVRSRRGEITLPAAVVNTIRPDTVFIPYHWPGDKAANQLTIRAVDPLSKMPEFKVAAVHVARSVEQPV